MATTQRSTAHYLAALDPDQQLIDATILERVEQLGYAQRDLYDNAWQYPLDRAARNYRAAFAHLDADLELLGRHSFPYFEEVD